MPDTIARGQADGIGYGKNQSVVTRRIMPNEKIIENTLVDVESGEIVETSPSLTQSEKPEGYSEATIRQPEGEPSPKIEPLVSVLVWRKLLVVALLMLVAWIHLADWFHLGRIHFVLLKDGFKIDYYPHLR